MEAIYEQNLPQYNKKKSDEIYLFAWKPQKYFDTMQQQTLSVWQ
jgi:hypothetical protein